MNSGPGNGYNFSMPANIDHSVFKQPSNPDTKIWRYMDFAKYVSLLDSGALWFSRADKLSEGFEGKMGDTFEGTLSHGNVAVMRDYFSNYIKDDGQPLMTSKEVEDWIRVNIDSRRLPREWTYVNSWHMNERESAAMWKLYARTNEAVAIQSTYAKLRDCLPSQAMVGSPGEGLPETWVQRESLVFLGEVQYIDYATEPIPFGSALYPFVYKRKSFEHEREVRAVVKAVALVDIENLEPGRLITVSLQDLVENVYVAPTAPAWFRSVVEAVTRKYGLAHKVVRSSLDDAPLL